MHNAQRATHNACGMQQLRSRTVLGIGHEACGVRLNAQGATLRKWKVKSDQVERRCESTTHNAQSSAVGCSLYKRSCGGCLKTAVVTTFHRPPAGGRWNVVFAAKIFFETAPYKLLFETTPNGELPR